MKTIEVKVPSIGDYKDVPVIDVMVKPGDTVQPDEGLVTLESDKATMDVPAPAAGKVKELRVKVGDRVSEGSIVLTLEEEGEAGAEKAVGEKGGGEKADGKQAAPKRAEAEAKGKGKGEGGREEKRQEPEGGEERREEKSPQRQGAEREGGGEERRAERAKPAEKKAAKAAPAGGGVVEVKVPSIGDYKDVPVIDVLVKQGDSVSKEDPLVTLESDKATMDVPSPAEGKVKELRVKVGDRVSEGSVVLALETGGGGEEQEEQPEQEEKAEEPKARGGGERREARGDGADGAQARGAPEQRREPPRERRERAGEEPEEREERKEAPARAREPAEREERAGEEEREGERPARVHASPSVRKLARELGVDLARVTGTGPRGRILHSDVQGFVKSALSGGAPSGPGLSIAPWPKVDFAKFGAVEKKPLSRIQRISGPALARNWVMIPHVTQFDEADITDLEAFRVQLNEETQKSGVKVTVLAFLVKACVAALRRFPVVNSSLEGDHLVMKRYFHIGFAADTPNGLVVPVVKDADQKGVLDIARELAELAAKAREGKLHAADMQGGSFSISSLGGIGGTSFTPIINAPEVAILGVSRSVTKPVWDGKAFAPRLILPLSLSYDHRVVDGALGARFVSFVAQVLSDMRRAML
jgi:pyruvate dehydrogenase E2 component (dihydrolipoamide acetyltransferase)